MGIINIIPDYAKSGIIAVNSYDEKRLIGTVLFPSVKEEKKFSNLIQLLELIEEAMDALEFPAEYSEIKSFSKESGKQSKTFISEIREVPIITGALATFRLKIIFRQNASWQGVITWVEGKQEMGFRSVYELIKLMGSALESKN